MKVGPKDITVAAGQSPEVKVAEQVVSHGRRLLSVIQDKTKTPAFHEHVTHFSAGLVHLAHAVTAHAPFPQVRAVAGFIESAGVERSTKLVSLGVEAGVSVVVGRWQDARERLAEARILLGELRGATGVTGMVGQEKSLEALQGGGATAASSQNIWATRQQSSGGLGFEVVETQAASPASALAPVEAPAELVAPAPVERLSSWEVLPFGGPAKISLPRSLPLRPYQEVAVQRTLGYLAKGKHSPVVNLPTGSGKTLVGVDLIRAQLEKGGPDDAVLVVAPSTVVAQQWRDKLCFSSLGLRLPTAAVYNGTPSGLARFAQTPSGRPKPRVFVLTQQGLDRLRQKGELEQFVRGLGVRHVVLDEVHKMVGDPTGAAPRLAQLHRAGKLASVVGLSATTDGASSRLAAAGFEEAVRLEPKQMIHTGYVPPYRAQGALATLSSEEEAVQGHLGTLRDEVSNMLGLLDSGAVRRRFAQLYEEQPEALKRAFIEGLDKYPNRSGNKRRDDVTSRIVGLLKAEGNLGRNELDLLLAVQLCDRLSDGELVRRYGKSDAQAKWPGIVERSTAARAGLLAEVKLEKYRRPLSAALGQVPLVAPSSSGVSAELGKTLAGTVECLRSYAGNFGAGLADAVLTIHREESAMRKKMTGQEPCSLVYAKAQDIAPTAAAVSVGPSTVPGLVVEAARNPRHKTVALGIQASQAVYVRDPSAPLERRVVKFARDEILKKEQAPAVVEELLAGLPFPKGATEEKERLRASMERQVEALVDQLLALGPQARVFQWEALRKALSKGVHKAEAGTQSAEVRAALFERIRNARNNELLSSASELFEWCHALRAVSHPRVVSATTSSGATQELAVVDFKSSRMKELLRNLLCRAADAQREVGIDMVLLTDGSAVGTDLLRPSVMMVAKRVNNPDSFRQLVGRLLRAAPSWTKEESALLARLVGTPGFPASALGELDAATRRKLLAKSPSTPPSDAPLGEREVQTLLSAWKAIYPDRQAPLPLRQGTLLGMSEQDRLDVAVAFLSALNKSAVTAYEVYSYRSSSKNPELEVRGGRASRSEQNAAKYGVLDLPTDVSIINPSTRTNAAELGQALRDSLVQATLEAAATWLTQSLQGARASG